MRYFAEFTLPDFPAIVPRTTASQTIRTGGLAITLLALLAGGGCQKNGAIEPPLSAYPELQPRPAPAAPNAAEVGNQGSPEALTIKTQKWANEMDALLRSRATRPGGADPAGTSLIPDELRLGPTPTPSLRNKPEPEIVIAQLAQPRVEATPSNANQGAVLAAAVDPHGAMPAVPAGASRLLGDSDRRTLPSASNPPAWASPSDGSALSAVELSLSRHLKDYPRDLWAHLDHQLIQFVKDRPVPQMDSLARLQAEDREFIAAIMDGLANVRSALRADNNMLMSRKVRPLLDMIDRLRAQADLLIPTVSLCTRVDGFGVYEPVESARFTAMKEHPILIYCEVENFSSQMNEAKLWETKLSQEVVLYTETGLPVWQDKTDRIPDFARKRRHDFFIVKKTRFPANITIGRYLL